MAQHRTTPSERGLGSRVYKHSDVLQRIPKQLREANIIPLKPNSKQPLIRWKEYQTKRYEGDFPEGCNFAVICGEVSGNLCVVDFDDDRRLYEEFFADLTTFTVQSQSGGIHLYFRTQTPLRKIPKFKGFPIDVQAEGSYVVIPPSTLEGREWRVLKDAEIVHADVLALLEERLPVPAAELTDESDEERRKIKEAIEEIKRKVDIRDYIARYVELRDYRTYSQGLCPFHNDHRPSFTVYSENYYCFGCGACGDVVKFVRDYFKISTVEAIKRICSDEGIPLPRSLREYEALKGRGGRKERKGEKEEEERREHRFFDEKGRFIAKRLADEIMSKHKFLTLEDTEEVLYYDESEGIFKRGGETLIKKLCEKYLGEEANTHRVNEVIGHIQRSTYTKRSELDENPHLICVKNGVLDLKTMELKEHSPDYKLTVRIPVKYDPEAECPEIRKFLSEILHPEDIPVIEELFGFCLYRKYFIHKAFMFVGSGWNGKSTLLALFEAFLGKENVSSVSLQEISEDRFSKAELYEKLANIVADLPPKALKDTGDFKRLVGEDTVRAQRKFREPFKFENYAKFIFSCNQLPMTTDESDAYYSRWVIVDFPNVFEPERAIPQEELLARLTTEEELSGLLNLALEGLKRLLKNKDFSRSLSTEEAREQYLRMSDSLAAFVQECVEEAPDAWISKGEFYSAYAEYCRQNRLPIISQSVVGRRLPQLCRVESYRPKVGGVRTTAWKGIRLKKQEEEVAEERGEAAEEAEEADTPKPLCCAECGSEEVWWCAPNRRYVLCKRCFENKFGKKQRLPIEPETEGEQ